MPKSKKTVTTSESGSDSGSEDKNPPPPAKKSKSKAVSVSSGSGSEDKNPPPPAKKPKANSSKPSHTDASDTRWTLEKLRFVNVREFRGKKNVDIREFYEKNGETLPGKKGISLSPDQWHRLLEIADEVTAALGSG